MRKILAAALLVLLATAPAAARSGDKGGIFDFSALAADSSFTIAPGVECDAFGWDMIRYTIADGPCTLFVYAASGWRVSDSTSSDTIPIPFGGFDMGAQGSFLPVPIFMPWALDSIRIGVADTLAYLRIYWVPRTPKW